MIDSKTRNRYMVEGISTGEDKINNHYEGFLNQPDSQYIGGFDWNTEVCVNEYFDNFKDYMDVIKPVLAKDQDLDKLMEVIKITLMKHIEMERDSLIVSMIDNMPEDELFDRKLQYNLGNYNLVLQQNSECFHIANESGEYKEELSDYVDITDFQDVDLFDMDLVLSSDNPYCSDCICKSTCNKVHCMYLGE